MTHVVSVTSAQKRQLPDFVEEHYHALVDDREAAAPDIAAHFAPVCAFVSRALRAGGRVYVHCGAGISRAPTATAAYLIWAHRLRAADALALVRKGRPCARPNAGFVRALHGWEREVAGGQAAGLAADGAITPARPEVMQTRRAAQQGACSTIRMRTTQP